VTAWQPESLTNVCGKYGGKAKTAEHWKKIASERRKSRREKIF